MTLSEQLVTAQAKYDELHSRALSYTGDIPDDLQRELSAAEDAVFELLGYRSDSSSSSPAAAGSKLHHEEEKLCRLRQKAVAAGNSSPLLLQIRKQQRRVDALRNQEST